MVAKLVIDLHLCVISHTIHCVLGRYMEAQVDRGEELVSICDSVVVHDFEFDLFALLLFKELNLE